MKDDPVQPPDAPDTRVARLRSRPRSAEEKLEIERRRALVGRWRFALGLSLQQIKERLAKLDPPIEISMQSVHNDVRILRAQLAKQFSKEFSVVEEFSRLVNRYELLIQKSMRRSLRARDEAAKVAWTRTAADIQGKMIDTLIDVGIFNKQLPGLLFASAEDGKKVDRVATGEEMQRYFENAIVKEGELVSDAERAYLYGDEAAVKNAEDEA